MIVSCKEHDIVKQGGTAECIPSLAEFFLPGTDFLYSGRYGKIPSRDSCFHKEVIMYPTLEEVKAIHASGDYRRIPVCREIMADRFTTIEVMRTLRAASHHCFILESAENNQPWSRYSFLGYDPTLEITCLNGHLTITKGVDGEQPEIIKKEVTHPGEEIRRILSRYKSPKLPGLPPFTGGLVGYFSYDYIKYAEPTLHLSHEDNGDFNDADLMLFDKLIIFDAYKQKIILVTGVSTEDIPSSYREAEKVLDDMENLLKSGARAASKPLQLEEDLTPAHSLEEYSAMVENAKHHIYEGDIFQVVLSNPLTARARGSLFDVYRLLRMENPSPYMFYFTSDQVEIAGSSPETLGKLENGILHTYPLAGTRPRGRTEAEDQALEKELLANEKELAEHNMLVDLGRNDLGKISRIGSVKVEKYLNILRFSHVMHIGSTVEGTIAPGKDAVDVIDAVLPAGTLSGAPKLRACEIIEEEESRKRGIYGGAIGYLDFSGNMDTCIGIRLAYKKKGILCVQSGAGIVADSVPEKEYQECLNKAKAVVNAIHLAEGGLDK